MARSTDDSTPEIDMDDAIDGRVDLTAALLCRDLDRGAERYLGVDRGAVVETDILPLLSGTPGSVRETLRFVVETGRHRFGDVRTLYPNNISA